MSVCGQFFQKECLIMQELRIVKTLETVLVRVCFKLCNNDVMPDLFGHRLSR